MAKALKIAAIVVGVVALTVATAGVALGATAAGALIGVSAATFTAIATGLSIAASILSLAAGALAKPPKLRSSGVGQQLDWRADPASGEPYVVGDAMVGTSIVHQASWGDKNKFLGIVGVLSVCTIQAYDGLYADLTQVTFSSGNATGYFHDYMYLETQLGAMPEATALSMTAPGGAVMPDWGAAYKTSGLATVGLIMVADVDNGKIYSGGTPKLTNRIRGVKAYDARADSTQPGGSGAQRPLNEATYVYSENPWVHAETYALGRWQNSINVIGPGLPADKINFVSFMEAANVADAHNWKVSGLVLSTDPKWDVLKAMAQAGGGIPIPTQAHLAALVNAPKVSLATITEDDVKGQGSAPQMLTRRQRLNGAIPRYRSADHGWEIIPGDAVRNTAWLAADGGKPATREIEFALVADKGDGVGKTQAAQLAAYAVANSRERGPISVELGFLWGQYKVGDCLTLNLPKARLNNQKCVVIGRSINVAKNTITLEFQTEDDAKHTWALGVAGSVTAPPTVAQTPGAGDGNLTTIDLQTVLRSTYPQGLSVSASDTGSAAKVTLSAFTLRYPGGDVAVSGPTDITGLAYSTTYYPYCDVDGPGDSTPTFGVATTYADSLNSATHPNRIDLKQAVSTPASGGGSTSGGSAGGGYGGGGYGGPIP